MKKITTITSLIIATSLLSNVAFAKSPSWDQVSVSYIALEVEDADDFEPTGFGISGMRLLNENFFIGGSYSLVSEDVRFCANGCGEIELELSQFNFGVGYRHPINETTDIYGAVSYVGVELEASFEGDSESEDDNGYSLDIGLRSMLTEQFEARGSISSTTIDDESETAFTIGASYFFNDQVSVGADYSVADDVNGYSVSLAYNF